MKRSRPLAVSMILRETPAQTGGGHSREGLVDLAYDAINEGSASFAFASRLFDVYTQEKVWMLYAWCRRCDDIADVQDMGGNLGDQQHMHERIGAIRALTARAFQGLPTADFAFDAFGVVAKECRISPQQAEDVIVGFEMDADGWRPATEQDLLRYCYHVAGAVGVMMAQVMGVAPGNQDVLDRASDLGIAFQLANIARDIGQDAEVGRCYIPQNWLDEFGIAEGEQMLPENRKALVQIARRLVDLMEIYAASAEEGTASLSFRSRWAVLAAMRIYTGIGRRVRDRGASAWDRRVRTSAFSKVSHVISAFRQATHNRPPEAELPRWRRADLIDGHPPSVGSPMAAE